MRTIYKPLNINKTPKYVLLPCPKVCSSSPSTESPVLNHHLSRQQIKALLF